MVSFHGVTHIASCKLSFQQKHSIIYGKLRENLLWTQTESQEAPTWSKHDFLKKRTKKPKNQQSGYSKWPFYHLVGGHDSPLKKGSRKLTIPKRSQTQNCQQPFFGRNQSFPAWLDRDELLRVWTLLISVYIYLGTGRRITVDAILCQIPSANTGVIQNSKGHIWSGSKLIQK